MDTPNAAESAAHPSWSRLIPRWQGAGLVRDLDLELAHPLLTRPPSAVRAAQLLAMHYDAGGDPVESAWRAQSDRYLELPDDAISPEIVAPRIELILPEQKIGMDRLEDGLEVRMAGDVDSLASSSAVVFLRRMRTHSRRGLVQHESTEDLPSRSLVYAINVLLAARQSPLRFVPLLALPGRRAWIAARPERGALLAELHLTAPDESWSEFARFDTPAIALAS